jgi:hypothetical protein
MYSGRPLLAGALVEVSMKRQLLAIIWLVLSASLASAE